MKKVIFNKKVRLSNIERILMINFPIMTSAIMDMQNKNNFGMVEYFDNISKQKSRKIKDKLDIVEQLARRVPLGEEDIGKEEDEVDEGKEENGNKDEKLLLEENKNKNTIDINA